MHRIVLAAVCMGLGAVIATMEASNGRSEARANEPGSHPGLPSPTWEETYSGATREQLVEALERRKTMALALKARGHGAELERLVEEIEWLRARTGVLPGE